MTMARKIKAHEKVRTRTLTVAVLAVSGAVALCMAPPVSAQVKSDGKKTQEEKALVLTPVDTLLKNVVTSASRKKALTELVRRLSQEEPDADILSQGDSFVKELIPILKNAFDKENSAMALDALVMFGKGNPAVVKLLLDEAQKGNPSVRVLAVNGIGRIGLPMEQGTLEVAKAVLMEVIGNRASEKKLRDEALTARVLLGPPFDANILPEVVSNLARVTDASLQRNIALSIAQDEEALKTYATQLEPIFVKNLQARPFPLNDADWDVFKGMLSVAIKLNTPNVQKSVAGLWLTPPGHWKDKCNMANMFGEVEVVGTPPPDYVVKTLTERIKVEKGQPECAALLEALASYGVSAESALPTLRQMLKDIEAGKRTFGTDAFTRHAKGNVNGAIEKIEKAVEEKKKGGEAK